MKLSLSVLALVTQASAAFAQTSEPVTYRCERVIEGWLNTADINDDGVIVGSNRPKRDTWHAATWVGKRMEIVPNLAGHEKDSAQGRAINRHGDLAGWVVDLGHLWPLMWTQGIAAKLPTLTDAWDADGAALSLNARGHAAGYSTNAQGYQHAVLWKNGTVVELGALEGDHGWRKTASLANAINASDTVVGRSDTTNARYHAVQWANGRASLVDLGASASGAFSEARAVNRDAVVVGYSSVGDTAEPRRPFGWVGGVAFDLRPPVNATGAVANDINDAGTVVGTIETEDKGAVVWPHYSDEPIDLNSRLDANGCRDGSGNTYRLTHATAINNRGVILAGSFVFPEFESFRLIPVKAR